MDNFIFDLMETYDYENIFFCQEKALGLKAIIVIHDTTLGPAAGGMRMWPYETEADALRDAVRLARGMTYKNAAAELPYGGWKSSAARAHRRRARCRRRGQRAGEIPGGDRGDRYDSRH